MVAREPAWRVFASELSASLEEERGTGERAVGYVLSPFGARMNRVLVAGDLQPAEAVGRDENQPFYRARLNDPTGSTFVTAGSFQPRALSQLRKFPGPAPALVVGKVNLFRGRDGVAYVSVRAEGIRHLSEPEYRSMIAEILTHTLDRLDLLARLQAEPASTDQGLASSGAPKAWVHAARESLRRYPSVDRAAFRSSLRPALGAVRAERATPAPEAPRAELPRAVTITPVAPPPKPPAERTEADRTVEALFLDVLDELSESSLDGYADLREMLARVAAHGVAGDRAEAVLNRLEEDGVVEEPVVGKIRRP